MILVLGSNFKKGLENLGSTLREVGENLQPSGVAAPSLAATKSISETSILEESRRKPLQIKILPEEEEEKEESDFSFLEDLSPESFKKFIADEKPETIAFIFSAISANYVQAFVEKFPDGFDQILKAISSQPQKNKIRN